jgi:hypothetical protein
VDERVLPNAIENGIAHRLDISVIEAVAAGLGTIRLSAPRNLRL